MKNIFLFYFLLAVLSISAQNIHTFKIVSAADNTIPVGYANIELGPNGELIAADKNGFVTLSKKQLIGIKEVYISAIGYALTPVTVEKLFKSKVILLEEKFIGCPEAF